MSEAATEIQKLARELGEVWEEINDAAELRTQSKDPTLKGGLAADGDALFDTIARDLLARIARSEIKDDNDATIAAAVVVELLDSAKDTIIDNGVLGPEPEARFADAHALASELLAFLARQHDRDALYQLGIAEIADVPSAAEKASERRSKLLVLGTKPARPARPSSLALGLSSVGSLAGQVPGQGIVNLFSEIDVAFAEMSYWDVLKVAAQKVGDEAGAALADRRCDDAANRAHELEEKVSHLPVRNVAEAVEALSRVVEQIKEEATESEDHTLRRMARLTAAVNEWISQNPRLPGP